MDIHKYIRKLNIKRYMLSNPIAPQTVGLNTIRQSGLANASLFNPPGGLSASLRVFRDVLLRDLDRLKVQKMKMTRELQLGLDSLCERRDLVIKPADKGGGYSGP